MSACLRLGAKIQYNAELTSLTHDESHWECRLADDSCLQTTKLVSASRYKLPDGVSICDAKSNYVQAFSVCLAH